MANTKVRQIECFKLVAISQNIDQCKIRRLVFAQTVICVFICMRLDICDWACKNRPCERKKSPIFSVFTDHNLITT